MQSPPLGANTQRRLGEFVLRHGLDAIFLTAPDGRIYMANPAACEMFGYSEAEFLAGGRSLIVDDSDPDTADLIAARERHGQVRGEHWMYRRDGSRLRAEVASAIFRAEGERRSVIIVRDVSRSRRNEYERRLIEAAVADAPLIVSIVDPGWRVLWSNAATGRITGYPPEDLVGHPPPLKRHLDKTDPAKMAEIERSLATTGKWSGEATSRRRSGELYRLYGTISSVTDPLGGNGRYVATLADVSALRDYEHRLRRLTLYDPVTGLPNRAFFEQQAGEALADGKGTNPLFLALVDIDGFRVVNESLGYAAADDVLRQLGERLQALPGEQGMVARHTGDSFALLLSGNGQAPDIHRLCGSILDTVQQPLQSGGERLTLTAGVGVSSYPEHGADVDRLLQTAEAALQDVKDAGGGEWRLYRPGLERRSRQQVQLAAPLKEACDNDEFVAYFQPIVDSTTLETMSMEVLARWHKRDGTIVAPADFIPVAERSGLIGAISETMLRQACRHLRVLDSAGYGPLRFAINLSARQFRDPELADRIIDIVTHERIPPERVMLEITESLIMERPEEKAHMLEQLQERGMHVVIDDFGTGYSSFGYLKHFHVDGIKLDRIFVRDVPGTPKDETLVSMMLAMGRELEIPVVAEGVETRAQARFLHEHGCSRLQGFLVTPPLPAADFRRFLRGADAASDSPRPPPR